MWWLLPVLLLVFIAVLVVRALRFSAPAAEVREEIPEPVDECVIADLQQLIRCKTVSYEDKTQEDDAAFEQLYGLLPGMFPALSDAAACYRPGPRSLIYHWKGRSAEEPTILMAHYDVVPADEKAWSRPAFEAQIVDGVMWGRGTLDTKGTFVSVLEAAETLIRQGFVPVRDIWLCFAGDEEIAGQGAVTNVRFLQEKGVHAGLVLDEGGAVVTGVFPGVTTPCAVVGTAEKGQTAYRFSVKTAGGHASTPKPHTPVGLIARAVTRVENHPFPFQLTAPALGMFDTMARRSTFVYRLIFANLWCFAPVLDLICKKSGGELNALVRTTAAFTQTQGSAAFNVIPTEASAVANIRLLGRDTTDSAKARLEKIIADENVKVELLHGVNPSAVSLTGDEPWQRLESAIRETWTDALVSPYMMLACSDSRHYTALSEHVYRFSAMALSKEERAMIHGNDERIPIPTLLKTVAFYQRLIRKC